MRPGQPAGEASSAATDELRLLRAQRDLAIGLAGCASRQDALRFSLAMAMATSGFEMGGIYLRQPRDGSLRLAVHEGLPDEFVKLTAVRPADHPATQMTVAGQPVYGPHGDLPSDLPARWRVAQVAILPILHDGSVIGCLNLGSGRRRALPAALRATLEAMAPQIGQAIAKEAAVEALRESEANLRLFWDGSHDAMLVLDPTGRVLSANLAAAELLGVEPGGLVHLPLDALFDQDQRQLVEAAFGRACSGCEVFCPVPLQAHRGGLVEAMTRLTPGRWNSRPAVFMISWDRTQWRRAEALEHEQTQRAELTAGLAMLGHWRYEPATDCLQMSGLNHMYEPRERGVGLPWARVAELILADDAERCTAALRQVLQTHGEVDVSYRMRALDGSVRWLRSLARYQAPRLGQPEAVVGVSLEVTDQQRLLEQQAHLAAGLRGVVAAAEELLAQHDAAQLHRRIVELARSRLGFDRCGLWLRSADGQWLEGTFGTATDGTTLDERGQRLAAAPHRAILEFATGDLPVASIVEDQTGIYYRGELLGFGQLVVTPVQTGDTVLGLLCHDNLLGGTKLDQPALEVATMYGLLVGNLLARQAVGESLRLSEERHRAMVEALPDLVFRLDLDGRIVDCSAPDPSLLLVPREEFLGRLVEQVLPPELAALTRQKVRQACQQRGVVEYDYELDLPAGRHHFEVRMVACSDRQTYAIIRDMTQRLALEETLRQAQRLESLGRLAGGVAHDFNNMLTVIGGHAELLLGELAEGDVRREDVTAISAAAQRSADLTRQLLAFARCQPANPQVLDLNGQVGSFLATVRRLIGEDIAVAWEPAADLWSIRLDAVQVDQVLANLAVNARDAMPDGGHLRLSTANLRLSPAAGPAAMALPAGEYVCLTVADTGSGIPASALPRIFEPFYTTKPIGHGTGLGLATVHGLVEQAGGGITVDSQVGYGTTFSIYWPRCLEEAVAVPPLIPSETAPEGRETVLVVEDEPAILEVMARTLRLAGYQVLAANHPAEAVRLATAAVAPVDLLVTDVVMPEMHGRQLHATLQAFWPHLPALFVSGYDERAIAQRGTAGDGLTFLAKPFTAGSLRQRVQEVLATRRVGPAA